MLKRFGLMALAILFAASLFSVPVLAQYNPDDYFTYLELAFNEDEKDLREWLIDEHQQFLEVYPAHKNAGKAMYQLASVYERRGKKHHALAAYLKMMFLYPDVAGLVDTDKLRKIIEKEDDYEDQRSWLNQVIYESRDDTSTVDAFFSYLGVLSKLEKKELKDWKLANGREYVRRFPNDARHDQVILWIGDAYKNSEKYKEAAATYVKILGMFKDSPLLMNTRYAQGRLYYENLDKPQNAIDVLTEVVRDAPDPDLAGDALFMMAEIKERKRKKHDEAIADYRKVMENYPSDYRDAEALWRIARIYEKEKKNHITAVSTYNEFLEKFPKDSRGVEALENMAKIYEDKLKDYPKAAMAMARISEMYPDYKEAPSRLVEAGELTEKKMKDYAGAIAYYQMVLDKYGSHKKAKDASKKMKKAQEKLPPPPPAEAGSGSE